MSKFSINKAEAGTFNLGHVMAQSSREEILNDLEKAEWRRPSHTPTIKRLIRQNLDVTIGRIREDRKAAEVRKKAAKIEADALILSGIDPAHALIQKGKYEKSDKLNDRTGKSKAWIDYKKICEHVRIFVDAGILKGHFAE